jgi:hypothetical protein
MAYRSKLIDRVHILRWTDPQLGDVARLVLEIEQARTKVGAPLFGIAIAPVDCPPPSDEVRAAMGKRLKDILEAAESLHFVVEGAGFKSAAVRGIMTAMTMFTSARGKFFIHSTVEDALRGIAHRLTMGVPAILRAADLENLLTRPERTSTGAPRMTHQK